MTSSAMVLVGPRRDPAMPLAPQALRYASSLGNCLSGRPRTQVAAKPVRRDGVCWASPQRWERIRSGRACMLCQVRKEKGCDLSPMCAGGLSGMSAHGNGFPPIDGDAPSPTLTGEGVVTTSCLSARSTSHRGVREPLPWWRPEPARTGRS